MITRYNTLKIILKAAEAKPGGDIGAMLAPYLFSTNLGIFCKAFNEQTSDPSEGFWVAVDIACDIVEKTFTFRAKNFITAFFLNEYIVLSLDKDTRTRIQITVLYDFRLFYKELYRCTLYESAMGVYSLLNTFIRELMDEERNKSWGRKGKLKNRDFGEKDVISIRLKYGRACRKKLFYEFRKRTK